MGFCEGDATRDFLFSVVDGNRVSASFIVQFSFNNGASNIADAGVGSGSGFGVRCNGAAGSIVCWHLTSTEGAEGDAARDFLGNESTGGIASLHNNTGVTVVSFGEGDEVAGKMSGSGGGICSTMSTAWR